MIRRLPIVPTLVVLLAVMLMIWLGVWQLVDRLPRKQTFLAQLAANPAKPEIPYPAVPDPALLFRRTHGTCAAPVVVTLAGAGTRGYRALARCHGTAGEPGMIVQLGTTRDPLARVTWAGGPVTGRIGQAPDARPWVVALLSRREPDPMLVADPPLAGLAPSQRPDTSSIPNNHLSYAVQWFLFALTALVIYALALRTRLIRPKAPAEAQAEAATPVVAPEVVVTPGPR